LLWLVRRLNTPQSAAAGLLRPALAGCRFPQLSLASWASLLAPSPLPMKPAGGGVGSEVKCHRSSWWFSFAPQMRTTSLEQSWNSTAAYSCRRPSYPRAYVRVNQAARALHSVSNAGFQSLATSAGRQPLKRRHDPKPSPQDSVDGEIDSPRVHQERGRAASDSLVDWGGSSSRSTSLPSLVVAT
jgi:hypothetical protein